MKLYLSRFFLGYKLMENEMKTMSLVGEGNRQRKELRLAVFVCERAMK